MAVKIALLAAGVFIGVVGGAAFGVHALDDSDMGGGADLTGVDGNATSDESTPSVEGVPDPTVGSSAAQQRDWIEACLDRLAWAESRNNPLAVNRSSGASGLLQFLPSTFRSTPQGRAGASIWDPGVQRAAGRWMINQGRLHEWTTWRVCA